MLNRLRHKLHALLFGLLAGVLFAVVPAQAKEGEPIRIGWTAWSDAEVVTKAAKQILEEHLGYKVNLVLADIGLQFQGVAKGDLDAMLMAWMPLTHGPYWERFSDQVVDMGIIYGGARLGWGVLGGEEKVHALSRKGFKEDFPRAAAFIENYKLPLEDLQGVMLKATESSYEEAVDEYLKANPEMVEQWIAPVKDLPKFGS